MNLKTSWLCSFVLASVLSVASAQTPTPSTLTIDQTAVSIRVDGHLEDWPSARMFLLNQKDQLVQGKSLWQGEDDFSGRVFLTYDEQYLYLSAIITKKVKKIVNDNGPLSLPNGDCLELFLTTNPSQHQPLLTRDDYHFAISPGTDCKDSKIFCMNKNMAVPGARLIARVTTNGYLLEGCIPLDFLEGLKLGPGKSIGLALALNAGGELSGYRVLRFVYGGTGVDLDDPGSWALTQWTGAAELEVPFKTASDLNSNLVVDGTKGVPYLGQREIVGQVTGIDRKPLAGVKVHAWPKGPEVEADEKGHFVLPKSKVYAKTVICARKKDYVSSVAALPAKGKPVSLALVPVPSGLANPKGTMGPLFMGAVLPAMAPVSFEAFLTQERPLIEPLHLGIIRLAAPASPLSGEDHLKVIRSFESFVQGLGAVPMVSLPLESFSVAVTYLQEGRSKMSSGVRLWAIGDEQDLQPNAGTDLNNAYTYLNQFRTTANTLKTQDPGILLWGPETGADSSQGDADWITPLLKYDGDIVNGISLHRYGWGQAVTLSAKTVQDSLRHEIDTLVGLEDRVSENSDLDLPYAITGGQALRVPSAGQTLSPEDRMLPAVWEADQRGLFLKGGLPMFLAGAGVWADPQGPSYWALRLWSQMKRGKILNAVSQESLVSVYATQDPQTKDVTLMFVNKSDRYWKPKIRLNGADDQVTVEAGLDQRYDFECPSFSVCLLEIHADRSLGQAWVLDPDSLKKGQPRTVPLKPW